MYVILLYTLVILFLVYLFQDNIEHNYTFKDGCQLIFRFNIIRYVNLLNY